MAIFSTQIKFMVPLNFITKRYGNWTAYAGFQYYHLSNDGLLDTNQVLATASRNANLHQLHTGISVLF